MAGSWGGIAAGIFRQKILGGLGGVSLASQLIVAIAIATISLAFGFVVYFILNKLFGLRLERHEEIRGSDLSIHHIESEPEQAL